MLDYRPGGKMKQEVYRFAYEEASSELKEIVGEFEQLRVRKERIEKVMDALKPFANSDPKKAPLPINRQSRRLS